MLLYKLCEGIENIYLRWDYRFELFSLKSYNIIRTLALSPSLFYSDLCCACNHSGFNINFQVNYSTAIKVIGFFAANIESSIILSSSEPGLNLIIIPFRR